MARMAKLDRLITLVHLLAEDANGLALDEMAPASRLTAEQQSASATYSQRISRWRNRLKGVTRGGVLRRVGRMFALPTLEGLAALKAEAGGRRTQ